MRIMFGLMSVLVSLSAWEPACAQGIFGLTPPRPSDLPVAPGRGIMPETRPTLQSYSYYAGPSGGRSSIVNPYWSIPVSRVTFLYYSPLSSAAPQPMVILPRQREQRNEDRNRERVPPPRRPEVEVPVVPEPIAPGAPASVFRPIRPEDRARTLVPAVPEMAKPAQPATPSRPQPEKVPPPRSESSLLPAPPVAPAPKMASAQQIESGKEAFKARQYSRAERGFLRAAENLPEDPQAHFLIAQARFALRKYAEAVASIQSGMRLQPDWPNARFRPRELYGVNPDDFSDQLKCLADALAKNPDDPFLAFLYAHQLWFDNRKDEARLLFQRAKALAADPSYSERFLQAKPGSPVDDVVVELLTPGPWF